MLQTLSSPLPARRLLLSASISMALLSLGACGGGGDADDGGAQADIAAVAEPAVAPCRASGNNVFDQLLGCVTVDGVRRHLAALQRIANAHHGTRVSGTPGFNQSADYAEKVLRRAGYQVTRQEFQFQTFLSRSPSQLEQVAPRPVQSIENRIMSYSGSGQVRAAVARPSGAATGCSSADFAGFPAGSIALLRRGDCTFAVKATNASAAGAVGAVIYNNIPGDLNGTLGADFTLDLPVTSVSQATGERLAATAGLVLRLKTDTFRGQATTSNVIAETAGGDANHVVVVGAHLDSVDAGPGINDNGSGSAAILETAVQMAGMRVRNKVRFTLWGAEESGLVGSTRYVEQLTQAERDRIALYLNFDMIASPNAGYFIYDGDDSDQVGAGPGPSGSAAIEKTLQGFYSRRGVAFRGTDFSGRSDYGPFIAQGIPSGGIFTGAEEVKTAEAAALWGGRAGEAYDRCYHQACDTYDNINLRALDVNSDAVAYATLYYAMSARPLADLRKKASQYTAPVVTWPEHPPVRQ
ncbi:M28 family metallopeptidase [Eleftheria terrae]|uniref:M28 family metallopeptidase n=1 Tax=Eleftheria terrae TaxID=1597781 RepID=UPI00263A4D06|nr:M28 family metallopeptidase [Eleftheria terrae]WKB51620.1 M28 family metallopeptidase [Eleftheria terrae]